MNKQWYNTLIPYKTVDYAGIEYNVCKEYDHISRYKGFRQVAHNPESMEDRFLTLEITNPFQSNVEVQYYDVPFSRENRLDLIANEFLGSPTYSWVIAYFNNIEDGFTVRPGQRIMIPKTFTSLFNQYEILASIPATKLQLGSE